MVRNIVLCCDGTNNDFGAKNTNVVRLIESLERDADQLLYYDPGVGTLPEPELRHKLKKWLNKSLEMAFGVGLMKNVEEAYCYLMDYLEPDDRVFLFGFSRGAYTVRVLAGLLYMLGLLPPGNQNLVPYLIRLYKSIRETTPQTAKRQWDVCDNFRRTFSRSTGDDRRFHVHFVGVWDTVSSVGWFWEPKSFPFTAKNPGISNVWHAVSIDERRAFFRQNLFVKADGQNFDERWFPGDHSDIGGGHSDGDLWRAPFYWIVEGARKADLRFNDNRLKAVLCGAAPPFKPKTKPHDLLTGKWKLAELVPKQQWDFKRQKKLARCNCSRPRFIPDGAMIDQSTLYCVAETEYRPRNFSNDFIIKVQQLSETLPDAIPFQWKSVNRNSNPKEAEDG